MNKCHPMPHFFGDILALSRRAAVSMDDSYSRKKRMIQRSILVECQDCKTHSYTQGDQCGVPFEIDFGCSGLPCTDFSRAGLQQGRFGPTNSIYMTHGNYMERAAVPVVVIECTLNS